MQEPDSSSWVFGTDPRAVSLLEDKRVELRAPWFGHAVGVAEAAREARVNLDKMSYFVERALQLGLLRLERVEARKGRGVKRYQTTGEVFFVPFKDIPFATLAEHIAAAEARSTPDLADATARSLKRFGAGEDDAWGRAYLLTEHGPTRMTASPRHGVTSWEGYLAHLASDDVPAYLLLSQSLELTPKDAKALQRDLLELLQSYEQRGRGRTYHLKLFLAEGESSG